MKTALRVASFIRTILRLQLLACLMLVAAPAAAQPDEAAVAEWERLNARVVTAYREGDYRGGLEWAQEAYKFAEQAFGPNDPNTLTSLNNLAALYESQGRYGEAEPLYAQALQLRREVLGERHPDTLGSLNNLAGLYARQGRYGEAEPLYRRALAINEKALGPDHPDLATALNNLAALYRDQGRYGEAELLLKRALAISEGPPVPEFPWPPPAASARTTIPSDLLGVNEQPPQTLGQASDALTEALAAAGYSERSFYSAPSGFALVTRLEQIAPDGTPLEGGDRWTREIPPLRKFSLAAYLKALFLARPGYYRMIVFVVTPHAFTQTRTRLSSEDADDLILEGASSLPPEIRNVPFTKHGVTALVYEFERPNRGRDPLLQRPGRLSAQIHLEKGQIWSALAR